MVTTNTSTETTETGWPSSSSFLSSLGFVLLGAGVGSGVVPGVGLGDGSGVGWSVGIGVGCNVGSGVGCGVGKGLGCERGGRSRRMVGW